MVMTQYINVSQLPPAIGQKVLIALALAKKLNTESEYGIRITSPNINNYIPSTILSLLLFESPSAAYLCPAQFAYATAEQMSSLPEDIFAISTEMDLSSSSSVPNAPAEPPRGPMEKLIRDLSVEAKKAFITYFSVFLSQSSMLHGSLQETAPEMKDVSSVKFKEVVRRGQSVDPEHSLLEFLDARKVTVYSLIHSLRKLDGFRDCELVKHKELMEIDAYVQNTISAEEAQKWAERRARGCY